MQNFFDKIPIAGISHKYGKLHVRSDVAAGLTVGVMLIPQAMAYAVLAGMPPIYGLYSATVPLIVYGILGTSGQLAVGPAAVMSLMIAEGVGRWAAPGSGMYISLVLQLTFLVGTIQWLAGAMRLGFLANFLSRPVIHGFSSAAALMIVGSQLEHLFGTAPMTGGVLSNSLSNVRETIALVHWQTFAIGMSTIAVIITAKRIHKAIPGALIALTLGTVIVYALGLSENDGVKIVGKISGGLPPFSLPILSIEALQKLFPTAAAVSFVGFLESFAVAKAMELKHPASRVKANREFIALGSANLAGSFFSAFPVAGGFARSAVNEQAGAKSGAASIFSAMLVLLSLVLLTPLFTYLPKSALSGIILISVFSLLGVKEVRALWRTDRRDLAILLFTFAATLLLGVEWGIGIAVMLSLLLVVYRASNPHSAVLGRLPSTRYYMNIDRFPEAETFPDCLIFRFDGPLFFANIRGFEDRIYAQEDARRSPLQLFVLDAGGIHSIDSSAMAVLSEMAADFKRRKINFFVASIRGPVRDRMHKSGLFEMIGESNIFMNVADAMDAHADRHRKD